MSTTSLERQIGKSGRFPPIKLSLFPLDNAAGNPTIIDRFLEYEFNSSVIVPIDSFHFTFSAPDDPNPISDFIQPGDIAQLIANEQLISTGIIDQTEIDLGDGGERGTIVGRNLMGQLEDQSAINNENAPIFGEKMTPIQVHSALTKYTRIRQPLLSQDAPKSAYLFGTEPGESKLASLQRYLEPLNCLAWMAPNGQMKIGRPNMSQNPSGSLILSKKDRQSNVLEMRAVRASSTIANIMIGIWASQEYVQNRIPHNQTLRNAFQGPARLLKLGHFSPRTIVVSNPDSGGPQGYRDVNELVVAGGAANLLQAYMKRELARENIKDLIVHASIAGHFNENGNPYLPDQIYTVQSDRLGISEDMYLFEVGYSLKEGRGQVTSLSLCRLGSIVSDVIAR